jgi:hypothetical protein
LDGLDDADVRELAIHRRVSRLNYSHRCAEASAVQAHMKQGLPFAPGMEIGYVVKDARKWEVDPERTVSKFDAVYLSRTAGPDAFSQFIQKSNKIGVEYPQRAPINILILNYLKLIKCA